jgi:hypothetical protein
MQQQRRRIWRVASGRLSLRALELGLEVIIEQLVPMLPKESKELPISINRFISIFSCGDSAIGGVPRSIRSASWPQQIKLVGALGDLCPTGAGSLAAPRAEP